MRMFPTDFTLRQKISNLDWWEKYVQRPKSKIESPAYIAKILTELNESGKIHTITYRCKGSWSLLMDTLQIEELLAVLV